MKVVVYKVNIRKHDKKKKFKVNVERLFFFSLIIAFTLLIMAQTALMSPSIRAFFITSNLDEGTSLTADTYLYKKGVVTLKLQNMNSNRLLNVLVNGDVVGVFKNKTMELNVKDGDVVELDGSALKTSVDVKIVPKSDNILETCVNKELTIRSGVQKLTTIYIKS
jgi:hypothetical protein